MAEEVRIDVLGHTRVVVEGRLVDLTRQDRKVLTAMAHLCQGGSLVESELVEEYAWLRPPSPRALRSAVYRARRALGEEAIVTRRRSIGLGPVTTDLDAFLQSAGSSTATSGAAAAAATHDALLLVRGVPFADLADHPAWTSVRETWTDRIDVVRDVRVAELVAAGDVVEAVALTRVQLAGNPLAIARWQRLVQLLATAGRPVEAGRAIEEARRALAVVGMELPLALRHAASDIVSGALAHAPNTDGAFIVRHTRSTPTPSADPFDLAAVAERLVQLLALQREALLLAQIPELLDRSPAEVAMAMATVAADGRVVVGDRGVRLADPKIGVEALSTLSPSERRTLAAELLAAAAWAEPECALFARMRLSLAAGHGSVDEVVRALLDEIETDRDAPLSRVVNVIEELETGQHAVHLSPALRAVLVATRAMALRELGRSVEGRAAADSAYRLAVRAGDADTVCEVLRLMRFPSVDTISDSGRHGESLARVWRPSATSPATVARVEALIAYHELARGPVADGLARGRRALAICAEVGDPLLDSQVIPMLICELFWDRSFMAEAEAFTATCRARGAIIRALSSQSYVIGGQMRRREISFDNEGVAELELLGLEGGAYTTLPSMMVSVVRGVLAADSAPFERLVAASMGAPPPVVPIVERTVELYIRLLSTPEWTSIPPAEFIGDPRRWLVTNPVDLALHAAAVAAVEGDSDEASRVLLSLDEPLLDAPPSVLTVGRLPLAALVARSLGNADVARHLLDLNRSAAGTDLCLLPSTHLGPTESWLAVLADVAQVQDADALHETGARRLGELGAHVLELA